jgi:lysophospholipase L1-like esterase
MNGWSKILACAICVALGVVLGIGFALARPGSLRTLTKKLGLRDANQEWFYRQTVAFHRRVDDCVPDKAVLFIGDSSIQGLCVTEVAANAINYGIGGDTTEGMLARLPQYQSLTRAGAVVVSVGGNDLLKGRRESEIEMSYQQILDRMPDKLPVIFCSLTPATQAAGGQLNDRVVSLNQALRRICASRPNCRFVDLNVTLCDGQGFLLGQYAESDGAHLNGRGNRVCIEKLRACLREQAPHLELSSAN